MNKEGLMDKMGDLLDSKEFRVIKFKITRDELFILTGKIEVPRGKLLTFWNVPVVVEDE